MESIRQNIFFQTESNYPKEYFYKKIGNTKERKYELTIYNLLSIYSSNLSSYLNNERDSVMLLLTQIFFIQKNYFKNIIPFLIKTYDNLKKEIQYEITIQEVSLKSDLESRIYWHSNFYDFVPSYCNHAL